MSAKTDILSKLSPETWTEAMPYIEEAANRIVSWWGVCSYPPNEREDLVQACRVAGWQAWYRHGVCDRALLYKFMKWAINVERRRTMRRMCVPESALCLLSEEQPASDDTEAEALARIGVQELTRRVLSLPRKERLCLIGSAVGMDRHEIAQLTGLMGKWSVRNHLWRIRRKLCS